MDKKYSITICVLLAVAMVSAAGCGEKSSWDAEEVQGFVDAAKAAKDVQINDLQSQIDALKVATTPTEPTDTTPTEPTDTTPTEPTDTTGTTTIVDENGTIVYVDDDTVTTTVSTSGYKIDNLKFNVGIDKDLDDSEVASLIDDKIRFDGDDYDVSEHLIFTTGAKVLGSNSYKDFEDDPHLTFEKSSIIYEYRIEDTIDLTKIDSDDTLDIKFLGKDFKIIDAEDESIQVRSASDFYMDVGDKVIINDKAVELVRVGSADAVVVDVDGIQETIPGGDTETVNGIEITNEETFYDSNGQHLCSATLFIGDDVEKNIDDGDFYDDDELWEYNIDATDDKLVIRLTLNEKHTKLDDDFDALGIGESISLPEGYLKITFESVDSDYTNYDLEEETDYYLLSTKEEDIDDDYKKVYLLKANTTFYSDDDWEADDIISADYVTLGDSEVKFNDDLTLTATGLDFNLSSDLKDRDEDQLDTWGIVFINPESWVDDDNLEFKVPEEQVEATVDIQ